MKRISRRYLNKRLCIVADRCDQGEKLWCGESLSAFCANEKNLIALNMLNKLGNISILKADGVPYTVTLNSQSYIYLLARSEKWLERLYGFISGVAATSIAGLLIRLVFG